MPFYREKVGFPDPARSIGLGPNALKLLSLCKKQPTNRSIYIDTKSLLATFCKEIKRQTFLYNNKGVKAGHFIEIRWGWGAAKPYGSLLDLRPGGEVES